MDIELIRQARERVAPYLRATPLVHSSELSRRCGRETWLKLETQQPTNSFKVRPAFNGALARLADARARGIVASSSGNFAQAVAYVARELGLDAKIVMPSNTSAYKVRRTRELGGDVVLSGPSFQERWELTGRLQQESGRLLLHPYDSDETIAGDGTLGLELLEQLGGDFTVVVPCSGGGLLAGVASAVKASRPGCRVVGVQPEVNGSMKRSLEAGRCVQVGAFQTIADALVASKPGERTFGIARRLVDDFVLVTEDEIAAAARWLAEEQKLVVEPGGAVGVAAMLAGKVGGGAGSSGAPLVFVLSGGNCASQ